MWWLVAAYVVVYALAAVTVVPTNTILMQWLL